MVPSCRHYSTSTIHIHTPCPQMAGMTVRSSRITQLNLSPRDWAVLHTPRLSGVGGNISEVLFLSARDTAFPTTKISPLKYLKLPIQTTDRIKMKCYSTANHMTRQNEQTAPSNIIQKMNYLQSNTPHRLSVFGISRV